MIFIANLSTIYAIEDYGYPSYDWFSHFIIIFEGFIFASFFQMVSPPFSSAELKPVADCQTLAI